MNFLMGRLSQLVASGEGHVSSLISNADAKIVMR